MEIGISWRPLVAHFSDSQIYLMDIIYLENLAEIVHRAASTNDQNRVGDLYFLKARQSGFDD